MTESIETLARRLDKAFAKGEQAARAMLDEITERHGLGTAAAAFAEMERRQEGEWALKEAEYEAGKAHRLEIMRLFEACPEAKTIAEVCRIMAERGDPFAQSMQAMFDSHEFRLQEALADAALDLHPGWRVDGDGSFTKLDPSAPEQLELIEWLYKKHPARARAIEESVQ
jgi:hypothetical protein